MLSVILLYMIPHIFCIHLAENLPGRVRFCGFYFLQDIEINILEQVALKSSSVSSFWSFVAAPKSLYGGVFVYKTTYIVLTSFNLYFQTNTKNMYY